jgi:hypothetical protein
MASNQPPFESSRGRRQLLLAAVVIALGAGIYAMWPRPTAPAATASNRRGAAQQGQNAESVSAPDVHLDALEAERPKPDGANRNLFRFRPLPAPPKPPAPPENQQTQTAPPKPVPPTAPGVGPIPFRFIGVMTMPDKKKVAILRDDRGVYYGAEGAEIDGRYKILRIGEESIEMAYLDGKGRQTLRLSGS